MLSTYCRRRVLVSKCTGENIFNLVNFARLKILTHNWMPAFLMSWQSYFTKPRRYICLSQEKYIYDNIYEKIIFQAVYCLIACSYVFVLFIVFQVTVVLSHLHKQFHFQRNRLGSHIWTSLPCQYRELSYCKERGFVQRIHQCLQKKS